MGLDTDMPIVLDRNDKAGVPDAKPIMELSRATRIRGWMIGKGSKDYQQYQWSEPEDWDFYAFASCGIKTILGPEVDHVRHIEATYRKSYGPLICSNDQEIYNAFDAEFVKAEDLMVGTRFGNPRADERITKNKIVPHRWPWQKPTPYMQVAEIILNPIPACDAITVRIGGYWGHRWTVKAVMAKQ